VADISYKAQFERIFSQELHVATPVPKPSNDANRREASATRVPFSNVYATLMRPRSQFAWSSSDKGKVVFISLTHVFGMFAPLCFFSWSNLAAAFVLYIATGMGVTYSYHRQLAHRSFKSRKWLEYTAAYCGAMAMQGAPAKWVQEHRYHHLHCETPLDPHSSYEGFYWSHLGWLLDSEVKRARCSDARVVADMTKQPFYRHMDKYYLQHIILHWSLMLAVGGLPLVCWRALGVSLLYHVTWFVNSAAHLWGKQSYFTGDQSRNNWWVGLLAFGEGWHNNHHAFEYSAKHGLGERQFDITWVVISLFKKLGLVWSVKLPTEAAKRRLALE